MRVKSLVVFAAFLTGLILLSGCQLLPTSHTVDLPERPKQIGNTADMQVVDVNYWQEGDSIFIVGVINNTNNTWQHFWAKAEFFDEAGAIIPIQGEKELYIPTLSPRVPPQGRTAFYLAFHADNLSKPFKSIRISNGFNEPVSATGILLAEDFTGYIEVMHTGKNYEIVEDKAWNIGFKLKNYLPTVVQNPAAILLFYGKDGKLWLVKTLHSNVVDPLLRFEKTGPLKENESTGVGMKLIVKDFPAELQKVKVERTEQIAYDAF